MKHVLKRLYKDTVIVKHAKLSLFIIPLEIAEVPFKGNVFQYCVT